VPFYRSVSAAQSQKERAIGANTLDHRFAPLCRDLKSVYHKNSPWFRVNFAKAKFQLGEAKEVSAHSRTDKADKAGEAFSLLLPRFSFEQRKA
jgi:hypothetical protein